MQCPACGSPFGRSAERCPRCGAPLAGHTPLVAGIPVIPLTASAAGPPAASDVSLPAAEPATHEVPAAPFRGYRPVVLPLPLRRSRGGRMRAALAGLALVIVLVAGVVLAHSGLGFP